LKFGHEIFCYTFINEREAISKIVVGDFCIVETTSNFYIWNLEANKLINKADTYKYEGAEEITVVEHVVH
jgi:hypothetical protein